MSRSCARLFALAVCLWTVMLHAAPVGGQAASAVAAPSAVAPLQKPPATGKAAPKKKKKPAKPVPPAPVPPTPAEEEPLGEIIGVVDAPRDYLAEKFVDLVSGIDRFFGDDRNYQESRDSVLQFDVTRTMGYGGERRFVYSGRAKIHLPNTEKRLHLLIESDPDKNTNTDSARKQTVRQPTRSTPGSYGAGVRYEKAEEERWHYSSDLGLKFQGLNTAPFFRARVSYAQAMDAWQLKAAETLFWFNSTGAGESTQLDLDHPISQTMHFRSTSNATWLHDKQNMDMSQDFSFFHTLDDRNALLYQASIVGVSRPNEHVTDYVLLAMYRYRLHRNWMFLELSPQVHFPKERQFRSSGAFFLRLEVLLDDSK